MSHGETPQAPPVEVGRAIVFEPRNIWQIGWVVIALVAVALFLRFVIADAGGVFFALIMAWFAALAMEPAVGRLARRMRRGLATAIVMGAVVAFTILFSLAFGQLLVEQVAQLLEGLPGLIDSSITWINTQFDTRYDLEQILGQLNLDPALLAQYAATILGGLLGLLGSLVGGFFSLFTFALFTFYFSADAPRLRRFIATLFPQRLQGSALQVWELTAQKTGGYVGARVILALINATTSAVVFLAIGLPSWLALAIWTGVVAQFVPTIGTYIAIVLPTLVGLLSDNPWTGALALAWGVLYQQVENLTIEPRISTRAVDVHPAVAFASVMFGTALFGVAGALLSIPVAAMLMALAEARHKRYDLSPDVAARLQAAVPAKKTPGKDPP